MVVDGAIAVVECRVHARHDGGDHLIVIGRVHGATIADGAPAVYVDRGFRSVRRLPQPSRG